ncbi:MAG: hypothetical protein ABSA41_14350 [Terriglobia bacterium]|jgi:hypothetical protein
MKVPNSLARTPSNDHTLSGDPKWELTLRVVASSSFQKSPRLRKFLLYVCEKALTSHPDDVHELQIGINVFERRSDYSPTEDNIVRVEAVELRKKLQSYFETDGKNEPFVIQIPKGAYLPIFVSRQLSGQNLQVGEVEKTILEGQAKTSRYESPSLIKARVTRSLPVLLVFVLLLALAAGWELNRASMRSQREETAPLPFRDSVWNNLFDSDHLTEIVLSDSCLVLIQEITHTHVTLADYLSGKYLERATTPELQLIAIRQFTGVNAAQITGDILRLNPRGHGRVTVRFARDVALEDLKTDNIVLIGSRRSNPWVELFESQRNFIFEFSERLGTGLYRNISPRPGELKEYVNKAPHALTTEEAYGVIAFVPNLSHTGNVLIIEGSASEALEGAAEFLTDPQFASKLEERLKLRRKPGFPAYFEVLLKTSIIKAKPRETMYVTHRLIPNR